MQSFAKALNAYTRDHPFDVGNGDAETVLDQLYQAYAESHESDPPEISEGFKELECFLESLPLSDNNAVFNIALCSNVIFGIDASITLLQKFDRIVCCP